MLLEGLGAKVQWDRGEHCTGKRSPRILQQLKINQLKIGRTSTKLELDTVSHQPPEEPQVPWQWGREGNSPAQLLLPKMQPWQSLGIVSTWGQGLLWEELVSQTPLPLSSWQGTVVRHRTEAKEWPFQAVLLHFQQVFNAAIAVSVGTLEVVTWFD